MQNESGSVIKWWFWASLLVMLGCQPPVCNENQQYPRLRVGLRTLVVDNATQVDVALIADTVEVFPEGVTEPLFVGEFTDSLFLELPPSGTTINLQVIIDTLDPFALNLEYRSVSYFSGQDCGILPRYENFNVASHTFDSIAVLSETIVDNRGDIDLLLYYIP